MDWDESSDGIPDRILPAWREGNTLVVEMQHTLNGVHVRQLNLNQEVWDTLLTNGVGTLVFSGPYGVVDVAMFELGRREM